MSLSSGTSRVMSGADWLMLISLSLLWGGSFFFNDIAVRELPTTTVVTVRVGLAAVVLLLVARIGAGKSFAKLPWSAFLVMGVLNNAIPFLLIVWAQTHIASGLAAILNATTPLFTVVVAHLLTPDERLTWGRVFGVIFGIVGVIVIVGPDVLQSLGTDVVAQLACLGAALSYAFAGVFGRRFAGMGVYPIETAAGQTASASLLLVPMMFIIDRPWMLPVPNSATIGDRNCSPLHRACLYSLFSDSRKRRGNEPPHRHVSDSDQRHRPWVCFPWGDAAVEALRRTGLHRVRSRGDRRARLAGLFDQARESWHKIECRSYEVRSTWTTSNNARFRKLIWRH
jgi:drug/metabolite transporter (DMT)-like permease